MKSLKILGIALIASILVGCGVPTVTKDPTTGLTSTNYAPNLIADQIAAGTKIAAPFIPSPWGGLVTALGVLGTVIAGSIATYQNKRANDHATILQGVIAGVEQGNNDVTKAAIQTVVAATGLGAKLNNIVQTVTANMPPPKA